MVQTKTKQDGGGDDSHVAFACDGSDEERVLWEDEFADYRMRLICVNELKDLTKFTTNLREVFALLPYRKDKKGMEEFLEKHEEYQYLDDETARTISGMIGVDFMQNREKYENEGGYNMCQAIREMMEDREQRGMSRAILGFLGARWNVSEELRTRIMEEKDLDVLSRWNILAATAENIEAFERQMGA